MKMLRQRVLLVLRDPALLLDLEPRLSAQGYEVYATGDLDESLRQVYQVQPDLILLSGSAASENAWRTLESLRQLSEVPVLLLCTTPDEAERARGLELGADDCLSLPFTADEVVARIHGQLRRH